MQRPLMTNRRLPLKQGIGMHDGERFLRKRILFLALYVSLVCVQEALLRRYWKMCGTTSENEGRSSISLNKVESLTYAASAEFLRKVITELRRELPQGGCSELLFAIRQYLSESSDSCFSRERNFADSLQVLVDKYQVHPTVPSPCSADSDHSAHADRGAARVLHRALRAVQAAAIHTTRPRW
jgi:hypothetical protein